MVGFSGAQKVQVISKVFADNRAPLGPHSSNAILQTLTVLMPERPPELCNHRAAAFLSLGQPCHPILTNFGLTSFDAESRVAPITDLAVFDCVLEAVELFHSTRDRGYARLLGVIEMARQDLEAVASSLMGFGM
ncbi:hypothetical protein EDB87DRAFT_1836186 [Lactarius vividus]|nr:hypothetical protein EDB87DRAFT_1836186 [Lactarius vividus]